MIIESNSVMRLASVNMDLFYLETCLENGGNLNLLHNQGGRPLSIALKVDNNKCLKLFDYRA